MDLKFTNHFGNNVFQTFKVTIRPHYFQKLAPGHGNVLTFHQCWVTSTKVCIVLLHVLFSNIAIVIHVINTAHSAGSVCPAIKIVSNPTKALFLTFAAERNFKVTLYMHYDL